MKRILLFAFFTSTFLYSQAQWVNIPDSNFGKWLTNSYPSCMQGNPQIGFMMDTSCSAILACKNVGCPNLNIQDLRGIEFFKNLEVLNCAHNKLTSLPTLPNKIWNLICYLNKLVQLPNLPSSLFALDCSSNKLNNLPFLPNTLEGLNCGDNNLTLLPSLPNDLRSLGCFKNQLYSIPAIPSTLTSLSCYNNHLSNLPILPNGLTSLYCDSNQLNSLPTLPDSLTDFYCQYNQIVSLPTLPNKLYTFFCAYNQLSSLPNLPKSVMSLNLRYNVNLSCLPNKIDSIVNLYIKGTNIQCMPNRFRCYKFWDVNFDSLPLCTPQSGCAFYHNIGGNIHQKTAISCNQDSISPGIGLTNVKIKLKRYGQTIQQAYTYSIGEYSFDTDSNTGYTISIDTSGIPFNVACPISIDRNVVLSNLDSIKLNQNFGLECKGADIGVLSIQSRFRAGRINTVSLVAGDIIKGYYKAKCSNNIGGTVLITFSGSVSYVGPALGALNPTTISGNTLSYSVTDFSTLPSSAFNFVLATDTHAVIGSPVCITVSISTPSDINITNNILTQCFSVVNSLDPNAKEVSPINTNSKGEWLTYTVHFQNTGNDTAYDVVVRDTLSNFVDANSFQFLASSQEQKIIQIKGNAVTFTFPNINLVDSATNPVGSMGWFQFRVKAKPNLPPQTAIENTAFIYFDFNPAIVTNTATTSVCSPSFSSITDTLCGQSIFFNGGFLTQQGIYYDTLLNNTGCDSIVTLVLISKQNSTTIFDSICNRGTKVFNGQSLTQSGSYKDTLINGLGCDSIITLILYVKTNPTTPIVNRNGSQLSTSLLLNHSYSWYLNNQPLIGQTDTSIQLTQNGNYYVTIFGPNSCTSSSAIFSVNNLGIVNIANANFNIYPNPNNGSFTLHAPNQIGQAWQLTDVLGRPIAQGVVEKEYESIQLKDSNAGVYIFTCAGQQIRLIVE